MMDEAVVRRELAQVAYPGMRSDIVSLGLVRSVTVRDGRVHVSLVLATERAEVPDQLRAAIRERLAAAGVVRSEVQIAAPARRGPPDPWAGRGRLPGVRRVVAVGAGKGGVGKSTVAVNLAVALLEEGLSVGLLDADIYGPSVPTLVGLEDGARKVRMTAKKHIEPLDALGLRVVSFGFFLGAESPAVWRGPMVGKAVKQFSRGVLWGELDVLVVDLPPGTGDVPLSLAQSIVVDGAVVVTTPQRLSVLEAAKAVEMFRKLDVAVLGVVENMSYAVCDCGRRSHPFGTGGAEALAVTSGIPLLGQVPFEETTVHGGDQGRPVVLAAPAGETAACFRGIARGVMNALAPGARGQVAASGAAP
ncbi:MAG TPA: Mrp/NBP35 family ATP-binding protein [Longimicrobiales bacterium]|nr:Mrp/NBP35 family ATP-binding protein [Longimicrobiales bacterium]